MIRPFSVRMWEAIAFIERNPREVHRQLDEAFENYDGHAMCAALYTMAEKRPRLKELISKFVSPPEHFEDAKKLMGKTMAEIRAAAKAMRDEAMGYARKRETESQSTPIEQGLLWN